MTPSLLLDKLGHILDPEPGLPGPPEVLLPRGKRLLWTGVGTNVAANDYVEVAAPYNAVIVYWQAMGSSPSGYAQVVDNPVPAGGAAGTAVADPSGAIGSAAAPLTAAGKQIILSVGPYVSIVATVTSGNFAFFVIPIVALGSLPVLRALTDRSGSITTGGTAQQLAAVNTSRQYLLIENPSTATAQGIATAESLWFNFTTTAVVGTPSLELVAGGSFVMEIKTGFVSTEAISVIAATTGHKWTAKEA